MLTPHKVANNLYESYQSVHRTGHSTKTAVLPVQSDILSEIDKGKCVFLVLLDLCAAFDTVSHYNILLKQLENKHGMTGDAGHGSI